MRKQVASTFVLALIAAPMILAFQNCGQGFEYGLVSDAGSELASVGQADTDSALQTFAKKRYPQLLPPNCSGERVTWGIGCYRDIGANGGIVYYDYDNVVDNRNPDLVGKARVKCVNGKLEALEATCQTITQARPTTCQGTLYGWVNSAGVQPKCLGSVPTMTVGESRNVQSLFPESSEYVGKTTATCQANGQFTYSNESCSNSAGITQTQTSIQGQTQTQTSTQTQQTVQAAPSCPAPATYYSSDYDLSCGGKGSCWSQSSAFAGSTYGGSAQYPTWHVSCPTGVSGAMSQQPSNYNQTSTQASTQESNQTSTQQTVQAAPTCAAPGTYYREDYDLNCGGRGSCWNQNVYFPGSTYGASAQFKNWYASCPN